MNIIEIDEALKACDDTIRSIDKVIDKLSSAKNWGFYDILGGGFFSSLIKHNKMNDAEYLIDDVNKNIKNLQKELNDINIDFRGYESSSSLNKILDIAFDNALFDVLTQNNINKNLRSLKSLKHDVEDIKRKVYGLKKSY